MFSWIIKNKSRILDIKNSKFTIENIFWEKFNEWISIAHDWACMTLLESTNEKYSFFVMEESLKKTNFWDKKIWDTFNVENSLKLSDSLDWHFVSGHIDTVWIVKDIKQNEDESKYIYIKYPKEFNKLIITKWSIAINWVSLTVVEDWEDFFSVSIIPHTAKITNIWDLKIWDKVNLEFDMFAKYINKLIPKK